VRARTSSPLKPKPLSNLPETKEIPMKMKTKNPSIPKFIPPRNTVKTTRHPRLIADQVNKSSQTILEFLGPEKKTVAP
jgi:hypothetical protein